MICIIDLAAEVLEFYMNLLQYRVRVFEGKLLLAAFQCRLATIDIRLLVVALCAKCRVHIYAGVAFLVGDAISDKSY